MSEIEWTDETANPITVKSTDVDKKNGWHYCIKISPGCANCYAERMNKWQGNGRSYNATPQGYPEMALNVDMLKSWAKMRKPKKHFVGSMTDLFGEWVPDGYIFQVLEAMANAPKQTFQILTKRPERMYELVQQWLDWFGWPNFPQNIWLGISAENQEWLDKRLPWLIRTPAQVRFLSLEPLLGHISLPGPDGVVNMTIQEGDNPIYTAEPIDYIDWVIIGGESGPKCRSLDFLWIWDILLQCRGANVPAFVKQLGSHWAKRTGAQHSKGGNPDEWPVELRVRMFPGEAW